MVSIPAPKANPRIIRKIVGLTACLIFIFASACSGNSEAYGSLIPSLKGVDRTGKTWELKTQTHKNIVINFFAENCAPCIHELASLKAIDLRFQKAKKKKNAFYVFVYSGTGSSDKPFRERMLKLFDTVWQGPAPILFADETWPVPNDMVVATPETLVLSRNKNGDYGIKYHFLGKIESAELNSLKKEAGFLPDPRIVQKNFLDQNKINPGDIAQDEKWQKKWADFNRDILFEHAERESKESKIEYLKDPRVSYVLRKVGLK